MNTRTDDLNDPLDDLIGGPARPAPARPLAPELDAAAFVERCPACRGCGKFISYTGRIVGACFKCKGAGNKTFKSSPAQRANSRQGATDRKVRTLESNLAEFAAARPEVAAWIKANPAFEFAAALGVAVQKFGDLTPGQLAAVQKCIAREVERKAAAPTVEGVDVLKASFDKAIAYSAEKGLKLSPRITVAGITISPAKATSANPGALYVKDGDTYLGKIAGGKFHTVLACTAEQQAKVLAFVANPAEAAKVYGQTTGTCCICNATLISKWKHRGIGPICAEKFGW